MARYDSRTTTFSPEGRLFQVEYAMAAIQNAAACVGIVSKDSIVIATERRDRSKLLADIKSDKIYRLDNHVMCAVAGLTSDANVLVSYLRRASLNHRSEFQENQPLDQLLRRVCDMKQGYTQFGGQRPFGVALLYVGYDAVNGMQLFHSDPGGNYSSWKGRAIGRRDVDATNVLQKELASKDLNTEEATKVAVKAFRKILDLNDDIEQQMEINIVSKHPTRDEIVITMMADEQVVALNKDVEAEEMEQS